MKKLFLSVALATLSLTTFGQITKKVDEFTGETHYSTPYLGRIRGVKMIEAISGHVFIDSANNKRCYIKIKCWAQSPSGNASGAFILFDDGSKLSFSEDVDYDYDTYVNAYEVSSFMDIDRGTLIQLTQKNIKAVRVYVHDRYLYPEETKRLRENFNLLLSSIPN